MAYKILNENTPRIRGVLFDMDGLVLDTEKLYSRFWREACACYGFPMTAEQSLRMRSANSRLGAENLREFFGPGADYRIIREKRIELMDAYVAENGVETKPGICELLGYLEEKNIPAAITSSSPTDRIQSHLKSVGLLHRFHKICSSRDVPRGKPYPDIYLYGAAQLGLHTEQCLALEDSPTGIEAAWAAGCHSVIVPDQDAPDEITLSRCFAKADSLADVIGILRQLE